MKNSAPPKGTRRRPTRPPTNVWLILLLINIVLRWRWILLSKYCILYIFVAHKVKPDKRNTNTTRNGAGSAAAAAPETTAGRMVHFTLNLPRWRFCVKFTTVVGLVGHLKVTPSLNVTPCWWSLSMVIYRSYFRTLTRMYTVSHFMLPLFGLRHTGAEQDASSPHPPPTPSILTQQWFQKLADTVPPTFTPPRSKCVELDTCTVFAQTIF